MALGANHTVVLLTTKMPDISTMVNMIQVPHIANPAPYQQAMLCLASIKRDQHILITIHKVSYQAQSQHQS